MTNPFQTHLLDPHIDQLLDQIVIGSNLGGSSSVRVRPMGRRQLESVWLLLILRERQGEATVRITRYAIAVTSLLINDTNFTDRTYAYVPVWRQRHLEDHQVQEQPIGLVVKVTLFLMSLLQPIDL